MAGEQNAVATASSGYDYNPDICLVLANWIENSITYRCLKQYTSSLTIYIKNMVCLCCTRVVKEELAKVGLSYRSVDLGRADIIEDISSDQRNQMRASLAGWGLELADSLKGILVERIKRLIVDLVYYSEEPLATNLSFYLSRSLHRNYAYLANVFSEAQGSTIERFFIEHKIEHVKQLLVHDDLSLTQIALKMQYSSVAHLSAQFKKVTGSTASYYKKQKLKGRSRLEGS